MVPQHSGAGTPKLDRRAGISQQDLQRDCIKIRALMRSQRGATAEPPRHKTPEPHRREQSLRRAARALQATSSSTRHPAVPDSKKILSVSLDFRQTLQMNLALFDGMNGNSKGLIFADPALLNTLQRFLLANDSVHAPGASQEEARIRAILHAMKDGMLRRGKSGCAGTSRSRAHPLIVIGAGFTHAQIERLTTAHRRVLQRFDRAQGHLGGGRQGLRLAPRRQRGGAAR